MAIQGNDKHGYYVVGWKKFYNKTQALQYSNKIKFNARWVFNDDVYGSIDWSIPIETSLVQLYKQRALQLREKYDHLILHYSGGQDSNNMLHSFIDNNIHLDELLIQVPKPQQRHTNSTDTDWRNYWGEIEHQAIPYLKQFESKLSKTKITIQDMSQSPIDLFSKDNWMETLLPSASYNIGVLSRTMGQYTIPGILEISEKGKTSCNILGIDKPLVLFDGHDYYAYFADQNAYHIPPLDSTMHDLYNQAVTEFFYWTPDLPEIVVKQAQEIKNSCLTNSHIRNLFSRTLHNDLTVYRNVMQTLIYQKEHAPMLLQTHKPPQSAGRILNAWFFEGVNTDIVQNYEYAIDSLRHNIDSKMFVNDMIESGYKSIYSKFYKL